MQSSTRITDKRAPVGLSLRARFAKPRYQTAYIFAPSGNLTDKELDDLLKFVSE